MESSTEPLLGSRESLYPSQENPSGGAREVSFSIIIETENLAQADLDEFVKSLVCLSQQQPPVETANEVILIDSGNTPAKVLQKARRHFPWLQVQTVPAHVGYYRTKMMGAERATGDIVVFYDSDCLYPRQWLSQMLEGFRDPNVQVVAGETKTGGAASVYGTAMAIVYIFPQFSGQEGLQSDERYFLNNVAFRRNFLLEHPIPGTLPLYRGNCVVHAQHLVRLGYTIWRNPQAKAIHAPPNTLKHFFWRFLLIGYDYYWLPRLSPNVSEPSHNMRGKFQIFAQRMGRLVASDFRHLLFFPLALPLIVFSALLIWIGFCITSFRPFLLRSLGAKYGMD